MAEDDPGHAEDADAMEAAQTSRCRVRAEDLPTICVHRERLHHLA